MLQKHALIKNKNKKKLGRLAARYPIFLKAYYTTHSDHIFLDLRCALVKIHVPRMPVYGVRGFTVQNKKVKKSYYIWQFFGYPRFFSCRILRLINTP